MLSPLLKYAALGNVVAAIENRLSKGDYIDGQDRDGFTALMYASKKGNLEAAKILLSQNANTTIKNNLGQTAQEIAINAGFDELSTLLDNHSIKQNIPSNRNILEELVGDIDINFWVVETETTLPKHSSEVGIAVKKTHQKITSHRPIDRDESWSDVEIFMPILHKRKEKLSTPDKVLLRKIIYQGYRDGFVSISSLEEVALDDHMEIDHELLDKILLFFEDFEFKIDYTLSILEFDEIEYEDDYLEDIFEQIVYLLEKHDADEGWFYQNINIPLSNGEWLTHEDEINLGKIIEESYLSCIKYIASNRVILKVISEDFKLICNGELEKNEIISEQIALNDTDVVSDEPELFESPNENLLTQKNADLIEFINIVNQIQNFNSTRIQELLSVLHINFKYIQSLVYQGRIIDSVLLENIESGIKARDKLVTSNLRLASHFAKIYGYRDLPFTDLVQEAFIGLIKAAERFEYKKGFRFTTYASWWIRSAVTRSVHDKSRLIRLPVYLGDLINKIERVEKTLLYKSVFERVEDISKILGISVHRVLAAKNSVFGIISIDSDEETDKKLLNSYDCLIEDNFFENVSNNLLRISFEKLFIDLAPRDSEIIMKRFGWNDGHPLSLEEIGELYGLTRERIRQIEVKVIKKLRKSLSKINLVSTTQN